LALTISDSRAVVLSTLLFLLTDTYIYHLT
jgi:hypothetical protein